MEQSTVSKQIKTQYDHKTIIPLIKNLTPHESIKTTHDYAGVHRILTEECNRKPKLKELARLTENNQTPSEPIRTLHDYIRMSRTIIENIMSDNNRKHHWLTEVYYGTLNNTNR